jgi:thymidine phosphorylase
MVAALGGPADFCERAAHYLPAAPVQIDVPALRDGWVGSKATRDIGLAVVELGGGRRQASDRIDHRVGFSGVVSLGQRVAHGEPLARVHAAHATAAALAAARLQQCIDIGDAPPPQSALVIARLPEHPVYIEATT